MHPGRWNRNGRGPRERGFTLVELLVAMTIFAIAVGVAFVLYNAAQGSYREGEQFTEQQQNTRIAFDRIVADLRMAGFNYNPDGDTTRPDEQIEGAWDTAVTVRGDFDFEISPADDPDDNNVTPETALQGAFNTVTTGNSEIVTFALGKPDGSGGVDLIFQADVQESARDGDVEEVRIPAVHLDQGAPPYTLYRITLNNDETDYGTWSAFAVKQPVADNIKSLTFRYFDSAGNQLNAFDLTQTADDIGGDEAAADVATRASIRRIEVDLVGLTPDPDLDFVDGTDAIAATRNYRKFRLTTDVVSQNLGLVGMPDLVLTAPRTPQNVTLCTGHCAGIIVDWDNAYASEDAVTGYTVWYGTDPADLDIPIETSATWAWVGGLGAGPYYFGVQARNGSDQSSLMTNPVAGTPADDTKPLPVASSTLWATGGSDPGRPALDSRIDVGWGAVTENTSQGASDAVSGCDPERPVNRDLAGYRLYRSETSPVPTGTPIVDEITLAGATTWGDTSVVNCRTYNYVVTAVDSCGTESDPSAEVAGYADTTTPPAAPTNVVAVQSSPNTIDVSWDAVTQNAATPPAPIQVAGYNVYVAEAVAGLDPDSIADSSYILGAGPVSGTSYQYWFSSLPAGYSNYFKTTALDDCPNESQKSAGAESTCDFIGTLTYDPQDGASLAGTVTLSLSVTGPQTYTRGRIRIRAASTSTDVYYEETWTVPFSFPSWDSSAVSPGTYEIFYEV
ncbi:MAG: prepilin-type N-terminal cleavage/methylation domain-containing protein, partial [Acidobacteria bacterium]|nr:prepilin-type N-terminal cleavage/methylation domain-containing protein [Acidobacteriota bacterium]